MDEILQKLLSSELLSEDAKAEISSQWTAAVETYKQTVREEVTGEVRAEIAEMWATEKDALVEKVDSFVAGKLAEEIEELKADIERFRVLEAEYAEKIDSYDAVIDILKRIVTRNDLSRKTFTNTLLKEITDFLLQVKMSKNEIPVDDSPLDDVELAKNERKARQEINQKLKLTEAEQIKKRIENNKTNQEIASKAEKLIHDLDKNLKSAIIMLEELGELGDFHKLVPSETINAAVKKVSKLNQLVTILV